MSALWTPTQTATDIVYSPTRNPSSSPILLTGGQLGGLTRNGDMYLRIRGVARSDLNAYTADGYFVHGTLGGQEFSLKFRFNNVLSLGSYTFTVGGSVIISADTTPGVDGSTILGWRSGDEIVIHVWYLPSLSRRPDSAGFRVEVNGVTNAGYYAGNPAHGLYNDCWLAAGSSPLGTPTAFAIGSKLDGTLPINVDIDLVEFAIPGPAYQNQNGTILVLGDSHTTSWLLCTPVMAATRSVPGYRALPKIVNLAHPGAKVGNMQDVLAGSRYTNDPSIVGLAICIGVNDAVADTATNILSYITSLVAQARASMPKLQKVIVSTILNLSAFGGGEVVQGDLVNTGILSGIAGVDLVVSDQYAALVTSHALKSGGAIVVVAPPLLDAGHPSNSDRATWATYWAAQFTAAGLVF